MLRRGIVAVHTAKRKGHARLRRDRVANSREKIAAWPWTCGDDAELEQPAEVVLNSAAREKSQPDPWPLRRYIAVLTSEMLVFALRTPQQP